MAKKSKKFSLVKREPKHDPKLKVIIPFIIVGVVLEIVRRLFPQNS